MKILRIAVGLLALVAVLGGGAYLFFIWNFAKAEREADQKLLDAARPAVNAVQQNRPDAREVVARTAELSLPRNYLYVELQRMGKVDLFPDSYRTMDKIAESSMVRWLVHPNELNTVPARIEVSRRVTDIRI